jgi:hypothetical protein
MKQSVLMLGIFVIISACSPEPVLRLQSEQKDMDGVMMYRGMEYLISEKNSSVAIIAYYRHIDDRIVMDLEVFNESEEILRIDPENVTYRAYWLPKTWDENPKDHEGLQVLHVKGQAVDPETILLNIDKTKAQTNVRNQTGTFLNGITATLDAVGGIQDAVSGDLSEESRARQERRMLRAYQRAERRDNYYQNITNLNDQRLYWESETLRTTDLMPGDSIAGEIHIPVHQHLGLIEIDVVVEEETHTFRYRQKSFDP